MVTFTWSEKYSVGIPEIDEEHQTLIDLGNSLEGITDIDKAQEILEQLMNYIQYHFQHEEEHMETIEYPSLAEHKREHAKLVNICTEVKILLDNNIHDAIKRVRLLLVEWIVDHIMYEDLKYVEFAKKRGA